MPCTSSALIDADAPERIAELLAGTPRAAHVVLLSEQDAETFAPDSWALRVERAGPRGRSRSWTGSRPSWFMQVFTDPRYYRDAILRRGAADLERRARRVAWIDARDIAAVAERALLGAGHAGRTTSCPVRRP